MAVTSGLTAGLGAGMFHEFVTCLIYTSPVQQAAGLQVLCWIMQNHQKCTFVLTRAFMVVEEEPEKKSQNAFD